MAEAITDTTERTMKLVRLPALREDDPEEQPVDVHLDEEASELNAQHLIGVALRLQREVAEADAWHAAAAEAKKRAHERLALFELHPEINELLREYAKAHIHGSKKSADVLLDKLGRGEVKARVGLRAQQDSIVQEQPDKALEWYLAQINTDEQRSQGALKWVEPVAGHFELAQGALRDDIKYRKEAKLPLPPGIGVYSREDKVYVQDLSKKLPAGTYIDISTRSGDHGIADVEEA